MNEFQESLKDLMQENELSKNQLAKIINISSQNLSDYFNNGSYPTIKVAIKLAEHFGCSLDYLFGLSDIKTPKLKIDEAKIAENFFNNFNSLLQDNHLTVDKAMKELNMCKCRYFSWQQGKLPKTFTLITIAKHFDTSFDFLIGKSKTLKNNLQKN